MDDLISPLKAVCVLDPAIDWTVSDVTSYVESRDLGRIQAKPGMTLTIAVLRALTVADFAQLDSLGSSQAKLLQAFRLACTAIENFRGPGTEALKPMTPIKRGRGDLLVWGDDELEEVARRFGVRFIYELGNVAFERAVQGNAWGGGVSYTLPQSSVEGLGRIRFLSVESSPPEPGTSSSEAPLGSSTPTPGASSGAAGAASAASSPVLTGGV